jgi:phospho-N-acetylmuramoyl-pentapeptide-transferase
MLGFGLIGFVDDYKKLVRRRQPRPGRALEVFWQSVGALVAGLAFLYTAVTRRSSRR